MKLAFSLNVNENFIAKLFLDSLPSYLFTIEILLNFNTAFYSKGLFI